MFVGREREIQEYKSFLASEDPWVLMITGMGGSGKSELLEQFAQQAHIPEHTRVVRLNFAAVSMRGDALKIIEKLAEQLKPYCNKESSDACDERLLQARDRIATAMQQTGREIVQTINASGSTRVTGATLSINTSHQVDKVRREVHAAVRPGVVGAFYDQLDTLDPAFSLIILLDSCEWLRLSRNQAEKEVGRWLTEELLPELYQHMQMRQRRCHIVVASRMRLQLRSIGEQHQQRITLSLLDQTSVDTYLLQLGVQEQDLRRYIYELTYGYPYCVGIIGNLCREEGVPTYTQESLAQLQVAFEREVLVGFINGCILDESLRSPYRELTRYGVLLRRFNLSILRAVFVELRLREEHYAQLLGYPYIEAVNEHFYTFNEVVRVIMAIHLRENDKANWIKYHKRARNWYTSEHVSNGNTFSFKILYWWLMILQLWRWRKPAVQPWPLDWYYHVFALNEKGGIKHWRWAIQGMSPMQVRRDVQALLEIDSDRTLKFTPRARALCAYERGCYYQRCEDWTAALANFEQACVLFKEMDDLQWERRTQAAIDEIKKKIITIQQVH